MADFSGLDRLWLSLLRAPVSMWARPHVLPEDLRARYAQRERPICYVLSESAIADLVVLEKVCAAHGLPAPSQALKKPLPSESVLFLERRAGFWGDRTDYRISDSMRSLVAAAFDDPTLDVDLIPVTVLWGRAPNRKDSWLRILLSENWERVGRFRRLLSLMVNGRNLFVQFGEPVSLRAAVNEGTDKARTVRRLTRALRLNLARQRAATLGPDLSHRRTMATQVLRAGAVRRAMADEMRSKKISRREALKLAQDYVWEIAANYSHIFVAFMAKGLSWFWTRLYDGVELHHVEQLQKVIDGNEVIYVPCHRSHIDYLLLSYVIYYKGYAIPHIAAGINLNMAGVGRFLRKGGAFFMRRSFKGNALYTMVFMKYLGLMMARGHSIEYFIEGGRSRTGRLLQPKTGMLSMTLRSYLRDPRRPIVFLPVYFGYERLIEGKTYVNEMLGKPKEKESIFTMLRTLPALRKRFGKVHVSFGEAIHLNEILKRHDPDGRHLVEKIERPAWLSPAVDELATRIMTNINGAACVAPMNLIATALLATPKQSMLESDLARQLELYASLLRQAPYSSLIWVTEIDGASIVRHGERMGVIQRLKHQLGDVMQMTEENSVLMTYFRNNVLHLMALPSLIACCFLNNRTMRTEDIQRLMWRIYPYVRDELFLRWTEEEMSAVTLETLDDLANHGLLESVEAGAQWRRPPTGSAEAVQLSNLAQVTVQIIERYYLVIAVLLKHGSGRISQDALETQCQLMAQRMSLLYELNSPEFHDKILFKNFIDLLRARNVLGVNAEGRLTYTDMLPAVADDAQLVLHEQIRNSVLQVTHR
ncbi:glycerol-3-phosphate acyltransferase [Steroidobacter agaridevorans]|uniref:Glycerol-3-phosphate acyltransferase n=1 Tax=Steroidobacter agaridevorans TaxID=2695856 RepID=A0A829Y716_9GAMM|nr:glycerol-3-phosphate 1-O-acyltransferase PlsB [Steroidobacter agaridevorans]GFE79020.1 glycerol-3-phosphate acyltransferase [Steroidobacter agaridevorans]GFE88175.1 glycerol-3-phosphate acyltransferase [Steroidobacter agaridevorans]